MAIQSFRKMESLDVGVGRRRKPARWTSHYRTWTTPASEDLETSIFIDPQNTFSPDRFVEEVKASSREVVQRGADRTPNLITSSAYKVIETQSDQFKHGDPFEECRPCHNFLDAGLPRFNDGHAFSLVAQVA